MEKILDINAMSVAVKVLLEGIEVPYTQLSISYGINKLVPMCSVTIPANSILRKLPEDTKILVIYQEPFSLPTSDWYVLFDGELNSMSYSVNGNSSTCQLVFDHAVGQINLMPMITQPIASLANGISNDMLGGGTPNFTSSGYSIADIALGHIIFGDNGLVSKIKTIADFVFTIIRSVLRKDDITTTQFYRKKIIDEYKITDRIVNVTLSKSEVDSVADSVEMSISS